MLAEPPLPGVDPGPARAAWQRWANPPDAGTAAGSAGLRALADHLDQEITPLTHKTHALSDLASAEVARREDRWAPVAVEVASWCADAAGATDRMAPVTMIRLPGPRPGQPRRIHEILATKAVLFDEYVRRSELKEHSPDAVDVSDLKAAEEVGSQVEAERRIIEMERKRLRMGAQ
jgi:hypothetical protein